MKRGPMFAMLALVMPWGWIILTVLTALGLLPIVLRLYIAWWDFEQFRLMDLLPRG